MVFLLYEENYELRTQHFTFVVFKNKILTIGRNQKKSHSIHIKNPRIGRNGNKIIDKSICSEWAALSKLKNTTNIPFNKITLINVRVDKNKNIKNSRPCTSCLSLCKFFDIRKIFYTNNSGNFEKLNI